MFYSYFVFVFILFLFIIFIFILIFKLKFILFFLIEGTIIYFKDEVLKSTLISNPQWFNNVFKTIMDYGRKKVQITFENFYNFLKSENKKSEAKNKLKKVIENLRGKANKKKSVEEIWKKEQELSKSNFDKVSYETMLETLEEIEEMMLKEGYKEFLNEQKEYHNQNILQQFFFVNENGFKENITDRILSNTEIDVNDSKFLSNLLARYDFFLPTQKMNYLKTGNSLTTKQKYIIPLLFPRRKPSTLISRNDKEIEKIKYFNEWIVNYFLPFEPSSLWRTLFLR